MVADSAPKEVFLSHSSGDRDFADRIARLLRRHGVPVWYSSTELLGAHLWHDEIGAALDRCDWFVLLLSPDSIKSMWVKRELYYALEQERLKNRIVPLLISACNHRKLSWTLSACQMIDFTQSFDTGCRELLRVWGIGYRSKGK